MKRARAAPAPGSSGKRPAGSTAPAPLPAQVRTLQHLVGNAGMRELARQPTKAPRGKKPDPLDEIVKSAKKGPFPENEPRPNRTDNLDEIVQMAIKAQSWELLADALAGYDSDWLRRDRLGRLSPLVGMSLVEYLRGVPGRYRGLLPIAEQVLTPWLEANLEKAVKADDRMLAIGILKSYPADKVLEKAREIQRLLGEDGVRKYAYLAGQSWARAGTVLPRALQYLQLEKLAGKESREYSAPPTGTRTETDSVRVPGGVVRTYGEAAMQTFTGGSRLGDDPGYFGLEYEGTNAMEHGFIQFLNPVAEKKDASGRTIGYETSIATTFQGQAEKFKWGTGNAPQWTIDTGGDDAPFYGTKAKVAKSQGEVGDAGTHVTTDTISAMYDRPTPDMRVVKKALDDDDVHTVVIHMNFHQYLVRGMDVLYENTVTVSFAFTGRAAWDGNRRITAGKGRRASKMAPAHKAALIRRFPPWSFYED